MIANEVNMNRETVRLIPTEELRMRNICAQMVPSAVFDIQMHYGDDVASFVT